MMWFSELASVELQTPQSTWQTSRGIPKSGIGPQCPDEIGLWGTQSKLWMWVNEDGTPGHAGPWLIRVGGLAGGLWEPRDMLRFQICVASRFAGKFSPR
jgi:hypothetical protein